MTLLIDFDRQYHPGRLVSRHLDRGVGTGPQVPTNLIVCNLSVVRRIVLAFLSSARQGYDLVNHLSLLGLIGLADTARALHILHLVEFLVELLPEQGREALFAGAELVLF